MKHTIFTTPLIAPCLRLLANTCLKLSGWRVEVGDIPPPPFVFIGAPHTSNWDFLLLLAGALNLRMDVRWMGKHTLFPPVIGGIMRWMGGIPVNRKRAYNMVDKMAELISTSPETVLCVPPEGTRSKVMQWKTGFYRIADQAGVPIVLAAIDAENRQLRSLGQFLPSGNMDADIARIQEKYRGLKGLRPENAYDPG